MEESAPQPETPVQADSSISWTASEFVAHHKSAGWYGLLALAAAGIAGLILFITHDGISVAVVIVAALLLAVYAARQPRQLQYRLDGQGIIIGDKHYGYHEFRSFSVLPEGAFSSIVFMPLKRFAPPISIYYAPEDEDGILNLLSERLPFEQARRDAVDSLMRRIRF
ncbi:hypothetical protein COY17_00815 [Candidatus Saccharibacteria bacterium CG_4_10_14_0_2_um_filter_52_9]|nr:MAG: hypothetical protein COY17_00815 [Candidatus Saccharibacteria bacterium CG_4_10_14_0_2_um_filter_52_9]